MSNHIIHKVSDILKIQAYNNGSYAYFSDLRKKWINIPSELGKQILNLK